MNDVKPLLSILLCAVLWPQSGCSSETPKPAPEGRSGLGGSAFDPVAVSGEGAEAVGVAAAGDASAAASGGVAAVGGSLAGASGDVAAATGGVATGTDGLAAGSDGPAAASGDSAAASGGSSAGAAGTGLAAVCGDGRIEGDEECEGALAPDATCESLGKGVGQLGCDATCHYDLSGCIADTASLFTVNSEISGAIGTVGIVTWSISVPVGEAHIEFGLDTGYGMQAPVDLNEPEYRTLLLGMKGSREYHFRIVAREQDTEYISDDFTIATGPVTNLVQVLETNVIDESARAPGFFVTSLWQVENLAMGGSSGIAFVVDADGDIVWWWTSSHMATVASARMSYDGKNMWLVGIDTDGIERVTLDGLDSQFYTLLATHDITAVTGDVVAYVAGEWMTCGALTEITPDGNTRVVLDTMPLWSTSCHGNAVRYSEKKGVYTYSDMLQPNLLVIDRATGAIVQQLADFGAFWNGPQHGHHLLDDSIVVYTNADNVAHEFSINTDTMELSEIWRYQGLYGTTFMGDVQRLPNGNTAVTYSVAGRIQEVDPNANLVMEMRFSDAIGYSVWRDSLYGPPPDVTL